MSLKRFSSFVAAIILACSMVFGSIPMMTNAGEVKAFAQGTAFKEIAEGEALEPGEKYVITTTSGNTTYAISKQSQSFTINSSSGDGLKAVVVTPDSEGIITADSEALAWTYAYDSNRNKYYFINEYESSSANVFHVGGTSLKIAGKYNNGTVDDNAREIEYVDSTLRRTSGSTYCVNFATYSSGGTDIPLFKGGSTSSAATIKLYKEYEEPQVPDEQVEAVKSLINAIPAVIGLDSEDAIVAARTAFDLLSPEQQAQVDSALLTKLTEAEETLAEKKAEEQAKVKVDASSISSFAADGSSEGTYIIAAKDSTGVYYALTKDMVYQSEVPDPETDSAYSFGKAEPIDVITNDSGAVTGVKANGEKIDNLKWTCSYEENDYYFWTSAKTGSRKQLFISSEPKGGIKIYPQLRSVKYSGNVMSATAKTGINYVFFKDTPDAYGLQFTGVLKEDGQEPDSSYNTSIYLFKVAGDTPEPVEFTSVDVTTSATLHPEGESAGTYFIAAKDSLGRYYAMTKDMVHQPEVPDPETDSADSFGFAEPIELVVEDGVVTQVKADSKKVEDLKWICTYESSEYYFWTSEDTSTRKQMFISSDPKGGIKIYPETRSVKYSGNIMSATAKTGINYVIFKDAPDYYGLQFSGVLKEDGQEPDDSYNTSIYLFKVADGSDPAAEVETARKNATAQIDDALSTANLGKYDAAEQAMINDLAKKYKDSISKAATAEEINKYLNAFKTELAKIQTSQEKKEAEEKAKKEAEEKAKKEAEEKAKKEAEEKAKTIEQVKKTAVKIKKPKTGKKKATAKWKANKLFNGYQVWYKMKAKGKKWKKVTVKGASKNKKVLKKLKKGKKYKIKVRGYKTIDGKKVYGKFSKTKTSGKIK